MKLFCVLSLTVMSLGANPITRMASGTKHVAVRVGATVKTSVVQHKVRTVGEVVAMAAGVYFSRKK